MSNRLPQETEQAAISKRQERAQRILDAASQVILRWGYSRATMEDIATQSGVGKGTIYLHWKTREELFAVLLLRERVWVAEDIKRRITADPKGYTLREFIKHSALAAMQRPLMKAVLMQDSSILGKLAQSDPGNAASSERLAGFRAYLALMREHGLVRLDLDLETQAQIWMIVFTGFLLAESMMPGLISISDEKLADMMAETIQRTLETDRDIPPDAMLQIAQAFARYWEDVTATAQKLLQRELQR